MQLPQIQVQPVDLPSLLVVYGPMGVMLVWFMWRSEKTGDRVVHEVRNLGKNLNALSTAMMLDVLSRDTIGPTTRATIQNLFDKMKKGETINPEDLQ